MNQQVMLKKLKKLQDEMLEAQNEIENSVFYTSAGGCVEVEVYGTKEIKAIKVSDDFEAESKEDFEMLSEMIVAACNQAYKEIEKVTDEKMKKYNGMLTGLGGLF